MPRIQLRAEVIVLAGTLCLWSMPARAQAPRERLPDRDVKRLIDQVDEGRDKFEGNLDNQVKNSTLKGANGDAKVSNVLQDYQDNTKKLQDRFTENYGASAEVTTVLKQAAAIDTFMQGTSGVMKGRKEWDAEAASLKHLGEAYGATFPLPEGATLHRTNDKELAAAADAIATAADRFKDDLDKTSTLAKPDKEAAKKDVELLIEHAESVKDHTSDGKPAAADVRLLIAQAAKIQTFVGAHQLPAANWQTVQASLDKVRRAFGLAG